MSYNRRIIIRRCKYCFHPLGHAGVIGNLVVCQNCFSSYPILTKQQSNTGLVILMAFVLTFAGHLLWKGGYLNNMSLQMRDGVQKVRTLIEASNTKEAMKAAQMPVQTEYPRQ